MFGSAAIPTVPMLARAPIAESPTGDEEVTLKKRKRSPEGPEPEGRTKVLVFRPRRGPKVTTKKEGKEEAPPATPPEETDAIEKAKRQSILDEAERIRKRAEEDCQLAMVLVLSITDTGARAEAAVVAEDSAGAIVPAEVPHTADIAEWANKEVAAAPQPGEAKTQVRADAAVTIPVKVSHPKVRGPFPEGFLTERGLELFQKKRGEATESATKKTVPEAETLGAKPVTKSAPVADVPEVAGKAKTKVKPSRPPKEEAAKSA